MQGVRRQTVLHGALTLLASVLVVKIIGALFKIPLAQILGGEGMGYFMTAYSLFTPLHALLVSGLPVAVSKLVAESVARQRPGDARRVLAVAVRMFLPAGLLGSAAMFWASGAFAQAVGNPLAAHAVAALAPAVLFSALMAALRGYYQGLRNMNPTAVSQVVEAVCKLICGIAIALWVRREAQIQYMLNGRVFGQVVGSLAEAQAAALPYAAAGAVAGIALSCLAGLAYLCLYRAVRGDGLGAVRAAGYVPRRTPGLSDAGLARQIIGIALPVCGSAVVLNLSGLIDLVSVINRLDMLRLRAPGQLLSQYSHLLVQGMPEAQLPNYLYGCYSGLAATVFNIVPALTATLATSALPAVAAGHATGSRGGTAGSIKAVLKLAALISCPAGLGMAALAEPVLLFLFGSRAAEVAVAAPLLQVLGVAAVFAGLAAPLGSMLQAVGRVQLPLGLMLAGGALKFIINYIGVAQPGVGLMAVPYGTLACYALIVTCSLAVLLRGAGGGLWANLGKPLVAAAACAAGARWLYGVAAASLSPVPALFIAVAFGALIYAVGLVLLGTFTQSDVKALPHAEKVAKTLEKLSLLG